MAGNNQVTQGHEITRVKFRQQEVQGEINPEITRVRTVTHQLGLSRQMLLSEQTF